MRDDGDDGADGPLRPDLYCLDHGRRVVIPAEFTVADDAGLGAAVGRKHDAKYDPWLLRNPSASIARLAPGAHDPHSWAFDPQSMSNCYLRARAARTFQEAGAASEQNKCAVVSFFFRAAAVSPVLENLRALHYGKTLVASSKPVIMNNAACCSTILCAPLAAGIAF